ncbi:MAG: arabinofuranan 3-O-arabinosyltransferase, partial [Actinomycetota bacterium]|nr:arabinofuranan 3-O-arabinosyltransferase [Actinomycetota bacterium]
MSSSRERRTLTAALAPLALLAYVPLLLSARGEVAADTKTYLYLDPSRLLARAWSMWDPNVGLGTVTHQTIGYLWPMGPWFWLFDLIGSPDWVAQRLWVATIMFAAGAGMVFLLRTLGIRHLPSIVAAALVYELSPYVLHYAARISVILLPWCVLPWLVALAHRSLRSRSWRAPAAFALLVATAGGVNATALVLVGIAPLLWIVLAVTVHGDATWRDARRAFVRIGLLTTLTSLWWIAGLWVQGGWGIDILRYTETVETVARTSLASEVLRGLGYWFFYGGDKLGSWIEPGRSYTQDLPLIAAGFAIPLLAFAATAIVRWRYRAAALTLLAIGTVIAVGAYPYASPSPAGGAFKRLATSSTIGLALRSTPRAVPLVALGAAMLIGAGLASRRLTAAAIAVGVVAVLGMPPLWSGDMIGKNLERPEELPKYWEQAAAYLDGKPHDTRVLELPGTDFASYRWGSTVDPITPGLIDRPYVARELIPYGTPPAADLLIALDRRMQEMVDDPDALAPVASLFGAGDVVVRSDLQYERYRTPRPRTLWAELSTPPPNLTAPKAFGPPAPNDAIPSLPLHDEVYLATPASAVDPPPVAALGVEGGMAIVRARSASNPIVLAGDGEGVVEAAAAGLLAGRSVLLTSAALTSSQRAAAMRDGAVLVLTDTNRVRGRRWSTMRDNFGYTEVRDEKPLRDDPSDNRLPLYPDAPDSAYTTVEQRGVGAVRATAYGNPVSFTPEDRPALAIDGDLSTAWQVGALAGVGGERWRLDTAKPVTASSINVVQRLSPLANRWITRLEVRIDGHPVSTVGLDDSSRAAGGQTIDLGGTPTFRHVELVVRGDNIGKRAKYDGLSGVGFAEVRVGDTKVDEVVHLPTDLLRNGSAGHPLSIVLTRVRSNPIEPTAGDEERSMTRAFTLPDARSFGVSGQARVSASQTDDRIDRAVGSPAVAISSSRLAGDLTSRASSAIDGDTATAWTSSFVDPRGAWIEAHLPTAVSTDHLDLQVLADGDHSVPTRIRVTTERGDDVEAEVPAVSDGT